MKLNDLNTLVIPDEANDRIYRPYDAALAASEDERQRNLPSTNLSTRNVGKSISLLNFVSSREKFIMCLLSPSGPRIIPFKRTEKLTENMVGQSFNKHEGYTVSTNQKRESLKENAIRRITQMIVDNYLTSNEIEIPQDITDTLGFERWVFENPQVIEALKKQGIEKRYLWIADLIEKALRNAAETIYGLQSKPFDLRYRLEFEDMNLQDEIPNKTKQNTRITLHYDLGVESQISKQPEVGDN